MSTSGLLLKKATLINPKKALREITKIMSTLGFNYTVDPISSDPHGFQLGIHDPKYPSDFCMYIFDKPKPEYMEEDSFSWISPNIYAAIMVEDLCDSEESVLKILHEYSRIHPDEFFYAENDWFYTMDDIKRIYESMNLKQEFL